MRRNWVRVRYSVGFILLLVALLFLFNNCGSPAADKGKSNSSSTGGSTGSPGGTGGPGGTVTPPPPPTTAAQDFFKNTVNPMFTARCTTCHTEPRFGGNAPLSLFNYTSMRALLLNGTGAINNALTNKTQALFSHTGSDQCAIAGPLATPCKEIMDWWKIETGLAIKGIDGRIENGGAAGTLQGWAIDIQNPTVKINVVLYVDGPVGTGTLLGTVAASGNGPGAPFTQGHSFTFTLPANLTNGSAHDIYGYGISAVAANQFPGPAKRLSSYAPTPAGINYFNTTMKPLLQSKCSSCHFVDHAVQYNYLSFPAPNGGGTALNNTLINKISGGVSHSGGNICGNKNTSPCLQMQTWWALEFP